MAKKVAVKDVFTGRRGFLTDSEYNRQMEAWAKATQQLAKAQAALLTHGKRRNRTYGAGSGFARKAWERRNRSG